MGCSASSDEWCRRSDIAIQGVPGTQKLVDDILISALTKEIALQRLCMVLDGCRKTGVIISNKKLKMGEEVKFGGYIINSHTVKPNPEKVEGISQFPVPTNVSELRSFLGLVNTFDIFQPDLAHAKATLNELLRKNIAWVWLEDHQKSFQEIKDLLLSLIHI